LNEGNEIKIGKEINKQCSELAIITQDLQWNEGKKRGKIAVVGATRLEYKKISHILHFLITAVKNLKRKEHHEKE
jgi:transcriptional regulator of heat shock response